MNLSMKFKYGQQQVKLQGLNTPKGLEVQNDVQFFKESTRKGLILQITAEKQPALPSEITALLQEFQGVFSTLGDLPPVRGHEHQINLKESTQAIC